MYFLVRRLTGRGAGEALESDYQGDKLTLGAGGLVGAPVDALVDALVVEPGGSDSGTALTTGSSAGF